MVSLAERFRQLTYGRPGVAIAEGAVPTRKGLPTSTVNGTSVPVSGVMVKADTRPPRVVTLVATYRNRPSGDIVRATGVVFAPAEMGLRLPAEVDTSPNSPSLPIVNADMVPLPLAE